ncbi:hypothetical protein BpHYR1_041282 [Brachionus plicatilis]|uniref:Uncharacterized protein n=1 Tax=Brachionus plicatilis TaxID=10195 RepID=A0A3M7PPN2_BRAPC|nr:hypothetical protein BpHYR1_041282 [Brachionus plicatilis]
MISSAEIRDVLTEYLKSVNNVEAYWIDYRSANEWSHHSEPIDFSICPSAGTSGQIYMNFKIDCFNNDINMLLFAYLYRARAPSQ